MERGRGVILDTLIAGTVGGLLFGFVLGHRYDYVGHFLAGYGGTLLLLATLVVWRGAPVGWSAVGITLVSIAIGAAIEGSIFKIAIFDPVDFGNQSLGAALACACVMARPLPRRRALGLYGLAAAFLLAGFVLAFS